MIESVINLIKHDQVCHILNQLCHSLVINLINHKPADTNLITFLECSLKKIKEVWENIPLEILQNLSKSMKKRLQYVKANPEKKALY